VIENEVVNEEFGLRRLINKFDIGDGILALGFCR
jgi:hypothetical protein